MWWGMYEGRGWCGGGCMRGGVGVVGECMRGGVGVVGDV